MQNTFILATNDLHRLQNLLFVVMQNKDLLMVFKKKSAKCDFKTN